MLPQNSLPTILALLACNALFSACTDTSAPNPITQKNNVITAASATSLAAVVNHDVGELPSVIVRDTDGRPVKGVPVVFAIEQGGGTATGIYDTTDVDGVARVGSWRVGLVSGTNVLSARLNDQEKILFSAWGIADAPARSSKYSGDNQSASAGTEISVRPQVRISDSYGNAVAGVKVVFAVASGGGFVSNATVVSDSSGVATLGSWVLGESRTQTMIATPEGLDPQTFTAIALVDSYGCSNSRTISPEIRYAESLSSGSCVTADGVYYEKFVVLLSAPAHVFSVASPKFDTYMEIRGTGLVASSIGDAGTVEQKIKTILPPGLYTLIVSSKLPRVTGSYQLSVTTASAVTTGCETTFAARETSTYQVTESTDCREDDVNSSDQFKVHLSAGDQLSAEVADLSYSNHYLVLLNARGEIAAYPDASNRFYVSTISFVAPVEGFYTVRVTSENYDSAEYRLTLK
ncbi:MAG: hypothetical protein H0W63_01540 [Gemmatimonadaceae bacterium]|nr:hypothetical protein [Gemmatimonadaceae bacterium]